MRKGRLDRRTRSACASIESLEHRLVLSVSPVTIGSVGTLSSTPRANLVDLAGTGYFFASDTTGLGLWRTTGTVGESTLVHAFGSAATPTTSSLVSAGSRLYFLCSTSATGVELWTSDGTDGGTALVRDIRPGTTSSALTVPVPVGVAGTVFFSANDGTAAGQELWSSDGTAAGTVLVKDINTGDGSGGTFSSSPTGLVDVGGVLYFSATSTVTGRELWKSDGTNAGTVLVSDINAGVGNSNPASITQVGGTIVFTATTSSSGTELWQTDGTTAGTALLADIVSGVGSSSPASLTAMGGAVYFAATSTTGGRELWRTDGTLGGTVQVIDLAAGTANAQPSLLVRAGSKLFFNANDGTGNHFWVTDGAGTGTVRLLSEPPSQIRSAGASVYFSSASDLATGTELWTSNGTVAGTTLLKDIDPGPGSSGLTLLGATGARMYLSASDGTAGQELWTSDGTPAGTALVKDINTAPASVIPASITTLHGDIYFTTGSALYKRAEATGIVSRVTALDSSAGSSVLALGDALYFTFGDGTGKPALWRVDGTSGALSSVAFFPLPTGTGSIKGLTAAGGLLYFNVPAVVGGSNVEQVYVSDGTPAGTVRLDGTGLSPRSGRSFTQSGSNVFFYANDGQNGDELWATDGASAGTRMVKDIQLGGNSTSGSGAPDLTDLDGTLVFPALTGQYNYELWRSDGTAAGTRQIVNLDGSGNPSIQIDPVHPDNSLVAFNGAVYFFGNQGYGVGGLWKTDGTAAGTIKIADVHVNDFYPVYGLTKVGDRLFFIKQHGGTHNEYVLWTSDGTTAGTQQLRSFVVDNTSQAPGIGDIVDVGGVAYFAGWNVEDGIGVELWRSDGTAAGTMPVADINPRASSSSPSNILDVGDNPYFFADGGSGAGRQIWREVPPSAPPAPASALTATSTFGYQVDLSWQDASNEESGFRIQRSLSSDFSDIDATYTLAPDFTTYADVTPLPGYTYFYRVTAFNARGDAAPASASVQVPFDQVTPGLTRVAPQADWRSRGFMTTLNGRVIFSAETSQSQSLSMVVSDGTNIRAISSAYAGDLETVVIGNWMYYPKDLALWRTDGTAKNTMRVRQMGEGSNQDAEPTRLTVCNDQLYFVSNGNLWRSDGTELGTTVVKEFDYSATNVYHYPDGLTAVGDTLYFFADDRVHGYELWKCDGTTAGTGMVKDMTPGLNGSLDYSSEGYNGDLEALDDHTVYIAARGGGSKNVLWKSDGTEAGTQIVSTVDWPHHLTAFNGEMYFFSGLTLYKTDGTSAGTVPLITTGFTRFFLRGFTEAGGKLFFENGFELYVTDGTPAGTMRLGNFGAFNDPTVADLEETGGRLYFRGGSALWTSDGTVAGTVAVPIGGGQGPVNNPYLLTKASENLYFFATGADGIYARLYRFVPAIAASSAPSNLQAGSPAGGATLSWADRSGDEAAFRLERSTDPAFTAIDKTITIPADVTSYVDAGVAPGTEVYYRVASYNRGGNSGYSNVVEVTAPGGGLPSWLAAGSEAVWDGSGKVLTVTGAATIIGDVGADPPVINATGASAALTINPSVVEALQLAAINVTGGAVVQLAPATAWTLVVGSLAIDSGSKLDLAAHAMIVRNSTVAAVEAAAAAGFNHGSWTGAGGITSSAAQADPKGLTAVGIASNADLKKGNFAGVSGLAPTDVLVKYTYYGDADLSGAVTLDDYTLFLHGYQTGGTNWFAGDYDFNGLATLDDFTLFLRGYQQQGAPL